MCVWGGGGGMGARIRGKGGRKNPFKTAGTILYRKKFGAGTILYRKKFGVTKLVVLDSNYAA